MGEIVAMARPAPALNEAIMCRLLDKHKSGGAGV